MDPQFPAAHKNRVKEIILVNDMILSCAADGSIHAWKFDNTRWALVGSLGTPNRDQKVVAHSGTVTALAFCGSKNLVISGSFTGEIKLWSLPGDGSQAQVLQPHRSQIIRLIVAPNPSNPNQFGLICAHMDGTVHLFDLAQLPLNNYAKTYKPDLHNTSLATVEFIEIGVGQMGLILGFKNGSIQAVSYPEFVNVGLLDGHTRRTDMDAITYVKSKNKLFVGAKNGDLNCYQVSM